MKMAAQLTCAKANLPTPGQPAQPPRVDTPDQSSVATEHRTAPAPMPPTLWIVVAVGVVHHARRTSAGGKQRVELVLLHHGINRR